MEDCGAVHKAMLFWFFGPFSADSSKKEPTQK